MDSKSTQRLAELNSLISGRQLALKASDIKD